MAKTRKLYLMAASISLVMTFASSVSAQGVYFDVGMGIGSATTKLNGIDVSKGMNKDVNEIAVDLGFKIGYGPIADNLLYIIGEFGGIGHRFEKNSQYIQLNSYLVGPGIIYYPVPLLQLGASLGYSFVSNQTNMYYTEIYESDGGFAWNVSMAVDFGNRNHGCLLGLKYFYTTNELKVSKADQESSIISVFVKYTYRRKNVSLSE